MKAKPHRAFRPQELALVLLLIVALAAFILARFDTYRRHAEEVAVRQMLAALRLATKVEAARMVGAHGPAALRAMAGSNPMRWVDPAPVTYLGEFDRPATDELPVGNWLYDVRDKTLVYVAFSRENFTFSGSRLLKFKVELTSSPEASGAPDAGGASVGLALIQVGGATP
ncbi:hypothetical protein [uncultured Massilia sp.]|uniref:hypothetical protein n=1 Tax=uncultured Massilia sp. TaxID=169973 RepID=UPI0025EEE92D|nr:hypothetical protein [uncultured Massilia sp.]